MARANTAAVLRDGEPKPGDVLAGRFRIAARLGRGGMGTVWRVVDQADGREKALKQLGGKVAETRAVTSQERLAFRREFHTLAHLRHPRIVEVLEYGHDDAGLPFYVMELLDGQDLKDVGPAPAEVACRLLRDVAAALAFLHARRLVHRDLAPRNVRCTSDGRAKLIDFGLLATVGAVADLSGTPPFIAPELVRRLPLDHRVDLFGLGALAYWLLTGQHAFPGKTIDGLELAWAKRPPAPSSVSEGVPAALDELVLALLSQDPLSRPASAAEVMHRLSAIGGLEEVKEGEAAHGWLASAALVGRHRELDHLRRRLHKAVAGAGAAVLVEAPSGTGKTRLLRELGLDAQIAGATVLRAGAESSGRGPLGVLRALVRDLLGQAPEDALAAVRPHAPVVARVLPELRERLGPVALAGVSTDPAEERLRLQAALAAWFLDVAARRPLVLLVDDVQRCDEASAAVLASLAHEANRRRLLVVAALRTDEAPRAPAPVASIRDAGAPLRLRGLDREEVEELVRALFGEVPHAARFARWMHRAAGGSPLHTTELARHLVDRGVIRFADGEWTVPEEPNLAELPAGLVDAMDARVRALGQAARALGEVAAIHEAELDLAGLVLLAGEVDEQAAFAALDELIAQEVLVGSGERWRFRHDGLREALLRGLPPERRRELHRRVGQALLSQGEVGPEREAEVGWHLLRGGDEAAGADLLERAGRALYAAQSFADAIPSLEAALEVHTRSADASPRVRMEMQHMLLMAGCMASRDVARRYAEPTVEAFRTQAGVDLASRLRRFVGKKLALAFALVVAFARWAFSRPSRRGPNPYEALRTFFIVVGYANAAYALLGDVAAIRRLIALAEPADVFRKRVPHAVYLLSTSLLAFSLGQWERLRRGAEELLHILATDRVTPISDMDRRTGEGGARLLLTLMRVAQQSPQYRDEVERLKALKLRFYEIGAAQAYALQHRVRGEEEKCQEQLQQVERLFVQLGSAWQMEAWVPVVSSVSFAFHRDMLGLKRTIEDMARLCAEGHKFEAFVDLARGEYHRERGELQESERCLRRMLDGLEPENTLVRLPALPALAETLLAKGAHEEALQVARQSVAEAEDPDVGQILCKLRGQRAVALCLAATGDVAGAAAELDAAVDESERLGSPSIAGAMHEARARVALLAGDLVAFEAHCEAMERWFRPTRYPALLTRIQRLADAGVAERAALRQRGDVRIVADDAVTATAGADPASLMSMHLAGCRGAGERAERILDLLLQESGAAAGYLYLVSAEGLRLAAPSYGEEPPEGLAAWLAAPAAAGGGEARWSPAGAGAPVGRTSWLALPMVATAWGRRHEVAVAALLEGAIALRAVAPELVEQIGQALVEAGDVTSGAIPMGEDSGPQVVRSVGRRPEQ